MILEMQGPGRYRLLGQTLDDAAGEAFDKVARFLGLGYPGGPAIEKAAESGDPDRLLVPAGDAGRRSRHVVQRHQDGRRQHGQDDTRRRPTRTWRRRSRQAVVDVLVDKAMRAADQIGAKGICLAGGVAANGPLAPGSLAWPAKSPGSMLYLPSRAMCTDNAAMVAAAGWWQLAHLGPTPLDAPADPSLKLVWPIDPVEPGRPGSC